MKKILALFVLIAIAGLVSINAYAHHNDFYGFGFSPFGYGYGFGGYGFGMTPAFNMTSGFNYGMTFAGFDGFNHGFTAHTAVPNSIRKIVPIPATASANTSISYDADGNIHVRPFDDEDLFVED
jgi:hypothetical protein